jgi:signal transduction histidine kinase/CheY-like chemotaxis protein
VREVESYLENKKSFVRYIGHEIRTPLNVASIGLDLLASQEEALETHRKSCLNHHKERRQDPQQASLKSDDIDADGMSEMMCTMLPTESEKAPMSIPKLDIQKAVGPAGITGSTVGAGDTDRFASPLLKTADRTSLLNEIRRAISLSTDILNDLLSYDKLDSENMHLDKALIKVDTFMQSALSIFMIQASAKHIKFLVNVEDDLPLLYGDEYKLRQVLCNLVSNALKFTSSDGVVAVDVRQEIVPSRRHRSAPRKLVITVRDSGVGISKENLPKVFKNIIQFDANANQAGNGSGLGLYITRGLVELHGGSVTVHSTGLNCGCTFAVSLPFDGVDHKSAAGRSSGGTCFRALESCLSRVKPRNLRDYDVSSKDGSSHSSQSFVSVPQSRELLDLEGQFVAANAVEKAKPGNRQSARIVPDVAGQAESTQAMENASKLDNFSSKSQPPVGNPAFNLDSGQSSPVTGQKSRSIVPSLSLNQDVFYSSTPLVSLPPLYQAHGDLNNTAAGLPYQFHPQCKPLHSLTSLGSLTEAIKSGRHSPHEQLSTSSARSSARDRASISNGNTAANSMRESPIVTSRSELTNIKLTARTSALHSTNTWLEGFTILLVDDSASSLKMLGMLMKRLGCKTIVNAADGAEAVKLVRESLNEGSAANISYDFVIMDNFMPVMCGPDACREMRQLGYEKPIVGLTGHALGDDVVNYKAAGATDVLAKPLDVIMLQEILVKQGVAFS